MVSYGNRLIEEFMVNQKTLKSLALLKILLDQLDQDRNISSYLDIYIPMVVELFKKRKIKSFKRNEIDQLIRMFYEEYGLKIPFYPMLTIINRMINLGYLKAISIGQREPVQIIPNYEIIDQTEFDLSSKNFDTKFDLLIHDYITFANEKHDIQLSDEQAYNHILLVLNDHDLDIAFINREEISILPKQEEESKVNRNLFYDFIKTLFEDNSPKFELVNDIVFGHIIASTILFTKIKPINSIKRKTTFFLDTGILFGLFGLNGKQEQEVYSDFVHLLQDNDGTVKIFEHTYQEFINIVDSCVQWIDNPNFDASKASKALLYFRSEGYHYSDVELFIKKFPEKLISIGIETEDLPDPNMNIDFQMDEYEFQRNLIQLYLEKDPNFDEEEKEETINYDVKSISAIFKRRRGKVPRNIDDCNVLFVTRNSTLAYASKLHENNYPNHDNFYIPTAVTDVFLGTILWLSSPDNINLEDFTKKQLISHCYAAMNPTKRTFTLFLNKVNELKQDGSLSEDDIIYLETSSEARRLLQEKTLGDATKITSKTPIEILNEVQLDAERKAKDEFTPILNNLESKNKELSETVEQKQKEIVEKEQQYNDIYNALKKEVTNKINRRVRFVIVIFFIAFVLLQIVNENLIPLKVNDGLTAIIKWILLLISILGIVFDLNIVKLKNKRVYKIVTKELSKIVKPLPNINKSE